MDEVRLSRIGFAVIGRDPSFAVSMVPKGWTDSGNGLEGRSEGTIDDQSGNEEEGSGRREFSFSVRELIPVITIVVGIVDDNDDDVVVVVVVVGGGGGGRSEIEAGEKDVSSDILFCFLRS